MAGNAMGALTVKVGGADYKLWLGMSVLADVQAELPEQFDALITGTLPGVPPMKLVHRIISGALERWHPEQGVDRYFVDELIAENTDVFQALLTAASPPAVDRPGKHKAAPK